MPGCDARSATRESVFSGIAAELAAQSKLSIYSVRADTSFEDEHEHLTVSPEFDANEWSERRKDDGFMHLVAYAALPLSAQEMVSVYRCWRPLVFPVHGGQGCSVLGRRRFLSAWRW